MDSKVLKDIAYGAKYCVKKKRVDYTYVAIPLIKVDITNDDYTLSLPFIDKALLAGGESPANINDDIKYTLYNIFKDDEIKLENLTLSISVISSISYNDINIIYTDGSFKKSTSQASYACCKLLESFDTENDNSVFDYYTGKFFNFKQFSGVIESGTNNIGELTGLKVASENFGEKLYQVIISDSEYSVKCMREWYHNWKANGFKTYSKKPVANSELIKETYDLLMNKEKIVLFKWTKAHVNNSFNDICDELAKKELGISK